MDGRVVWNDHVSFVQQTSPRVVHLFASMAAPEGSGAGRPTGDPCDTYGPLPMVGVGVPEPVPSSRSDAISTPVGRTALTMSVARYSSTLTVEPAGSAMVESVIVGQMPSGR